MNFAEKAFCPTSSPNTGAVENYLSDELVHEVVNQVNAEKLLIEILNPITIRCSFFELRWMYLVMELTAVEEF